jgi:hypothetical protein
VAGIWQRFRSWPLWAQLLAGLVVLAIVVSPFAGGDDDKDATKTADTTADVPRSAPSADDQPSSSDDSAQGSQFEDIEFPDGYAPEVRERIIEMADAGNCMGLQAEFDQAEENGSSRNGFNAELMAAIDEFMSEANCYSDR